MKYRKLIFLDIDGVLNTHSSIKKAMFDPQCVDNLNTLIHLTYAGVVLSSSWRYHIYNGNMSPMGFYYLLASHGVECNLVGYTCPDELIKEREGQIKHWIEQNNFTGKYVSLDDMDLKGIPIVRTNGWVGLTLEDVDKAVEILDCHSQTENYYNKGV